MTTIGTAVKRLRDKAGSEEFLRSALKNILQFLMDTEYPGTSRRLGMSGHLTGAITETVTANAGLVTVSGSCSCIFPNCGVVHTFRNFWSRAA